MSNKVTVFRVITSNYCVSTHLNNTLNRIPANINMVIIGDNVEGFRSIYNNVKFINVPLKRRFNVFLDLYSFCLLFYYFLKFRPKVVHSLMLKAGVYSAILAFLLNIEVRVHTFTGQIWANKFGWKKAFLKFLDRLICQLNTHCFTDSKSQSDFLSENGITHKGSLIPYFYNGSISGVDLKKFDSYKIVDEKNRLIKVHSLENVDFVLGYIARKSLDKGCIDMLNILLDVVTSEKNINIKLLFIGPDESNGEIEKFHKSNPEILKYIVDLGFVNNHHHYISVCNLMCLPSHREGFGSIVIDSAAIGVPTIGYDIPGLKDSISNNYSGILIPFGDKYAFSQKIIELFHHNDELLKLSKNARSYACEFFDADKVNFELFKFYLES